MKWICNKKTAEIGKSLAAIGLALVIGALFILLAGESPIRAYTSMIQGALGTPQSIANTISKSILWLLPAWQWPWGRGAAC